MVKKMLIALAALIMGCSKEESREPNPQDKQTAIELQATLTGKALRLASYTSDKPLDYYPDDQVGAETDHWKWVSGWIHDDSTLLQANTALIYQNGKTIPSDGNPVLNRDWNVSADNKGVHVLYVGNEYQPLTYDYQSKTDSSVTLYVYRGETKLISVFKYLH